MTRSIFHCLMVACLLAAGSAQRAEHLLAQNLCNNKMICSDCFRTASCAWCFADDFNAPRCFNPAIDMGNGQCDEVYIFNPDNQISIDPKYNQDLSRAKSRMSEPSYFEESQGSEADAGGSHGEGIAASSEDNLVQIKPQRVQLKLRLNQKQTLEFSYSEAQDYPVDLYYLMDLSRSMKKDKEKLSTLGSRLSSTKKNITSNFRIGFGSFVEKVVMPYVSTIPKNLISPCEDCAAPYSYRNHMSLSKDTYFFEKTVAYASMSGDLDSPEGGFDAIMQAIVCKDVIGWRENSRRLLVFSSDAGFHFAGDGKLGGILQPNDGDCHMENNFYTHSTIQDYPSIAQINDKVKTHAINIIFAVTKEQIGVYEQLSQHIQGSSFGMLSNNSGNIVELVKEQYNKMTQSVVIKDTSSDAIQITYLSSCLNKGKMLRTNRCDGLKVKIFQTFRQQLRLTSSVGDVIEFQAEIILKKCPKDESKWKETFIIYSVGMSETLTVELEMLCDCPCEHPGHFAYKKGPSECNSHGKSVCGVCQCDPGLFGRRCECSTTGGALLEKEHDCKPTNTTTGTLCSGRGNCICGECECNKLDDPTRVISGPFCECDNFSCDMNKGELCSGSEQGFCICGSCACHAGFTGPACQCALDDAPCKSPDGILCGGHGKCVCGECVCDLDANNKPMYTGRFCENCPSYSPKTCKDLTSCIMCVGHKIGPEFNPDKEEIESQCGECWKEGHYDIVEKGRIEVNETMNEHLCNFYDEEECLHVFVYQADYNRRLSFRIQKEAECPQKVSIIGIVLGVIAVIVTMGLALLILWKMVTTIQDRREFAKFERERAMAKWDTAENPIFKQATSTFKNPAYGGLRLQS